MEKFIENYCHTDAGRGASAMPEKKDCTVRSFATARGVSYLEAHKALASLGRRPGKGFKFSLVAFKRPDLFTRTQLPKGSRKRVRTLLRTTLSKGRYVLRIRGHVFAAVNGVAHDITPYCCLQNCIVTDIYTAI